MPSDGVLDLSWVSALLVMPSFVASGAAGRVVATATQRNNSFLARDSPKFLAAVLQCPSVRAVVKHQSALVRSTAATSTNIMVSGRRVMQLRAASEEDTNVDKCRIVAWSRCAAGTKWRPATRRNGCRRRKAKRMRRAFRHVDYTAVLDPGLLHAPLPSSRCRPRKLAMGKLALKALEVRSGTKTVDFCNDDPSMTFCCCRD